MHDASIWASAPAVLWGRGLAPGIVRKNGHAFTRKEMFFVKPKVSCLIALRLAWHADPLKVAWRIYRKIQRPVPELKQVAGAAKAKGYINQRRHLAHDATGSIPSRLLYSRRMAA